MNRKSGWCIAARYGGLYGNGGGISKVDSMIMLKFRPIAPKPVAVVASSDHGGYVKYCAAAGRTKRKYVRVNNKKKKDDDKIMKAPAAVVTLSLLPETPDRKQINESGTGRRRSSDLTSAKSCNYNNNMKILAAPAWLSFNNQLQVKPISMQVDDIIGTVVMKQRRVVSSCVTVECVGDDMTWMNLDVEGLGVMSDDEEKMMKMEKDRCPGFISDGEDRVVWTNKAYREMVVVEAEEDNIDDIRVVLVRKDIRSWPAAITYPASFTCKVSWLSSGEQQHQTTLTVPCDVWRMNYEVGAFAWRLDVKAALSLGPR